jgi:hydroxylysine kinase
MSSISELSNFTSVCPPDFATQAVAAAVLDQFGLAGDYEPLVSERDQNFRLSTNDGARYVVKVTSLTEDPIVTECQIAALIHLEGHGVSWVPKVVRTMSGDDHGVIHGEDGAEICLRVVTWLSGRLLSDVELTEETARQFGQQLAELDLAFSDFSHEGEQQVLLWDTQRADRLRRLLDHVDDSDVRCEVESVLDTFVNNVSPALKTLSSQMIHNDANTENILLDSDGAVSGIIDFGDVLKAPRIIEVSTAAAYLRADGDDRLRVIAPFVAGYHHRSPLLQAELELLFDLIRTRLSMTLIILYWRLSARDENDPYRQKTLASESDAFDFLRFLSSVGHDAFLNRIGLQ